jgi:NitT/TauT family transport system substrate-binding protein
MVVGNREFVRRYPVATKRVVRGLMKANEVCALIPDRSAQAADWRFLRELKKELKG